MSVLAIACDNCGAKYRLPESFSGDKAKCQKCGSVIDVAAQRKTAGAPATAPAPAPKTASVPLSPPTRKKESAVGTRAASTSAAKVEAAPTRLARSSRGTSAEPAEAKDGKSGRTRGDRKEAGEREPKKNNTMLLAGGGIAALAIVAVIVVLGSGRKEPAKGTDQAVVGNQEAAKPAPEASKQDVAPPQPKVEPKTEPKTEPAPVLADASSKLLDGKAEPAVATTEKPAAKEAEAPAQPADDGTPKEKWERNTTKSIDEVFDVKSLGELPWTAEADDAKREEVRALVATVVDGGKPARAAKTELEKMGYFAAFGIVERLRQLDYKSSSEQMTAWEFNKVLETIFAGLNAGFVAVEDGVDLDPRKADHNARTAEAWSRFLGKYPTKAEFDAWRKERLNRAK